MNRDAFEGKWQKLRGEVKAWWGKLTDADIEKINGQFDVFVDLLQEHYGYSREHAAEEIEKQIEQYEIWLKKKGMPAL